MSGYAKYRDLDENYASSDSRQKVITTNPAPNRRADKYLTSRALDDDNALSIAPTTEPMDVSEPSQAGLRKRA